jgi:RimJ/RimL family protein N-acetyltransferase
LRQSFQGLEPDFLDIFWMPEKAETAVPSTSATRMQVDLALRLCPLLDTDRLTLEPMGERHADAFFESLHDDAIYQWISMDKPSSLEQLRGQLRRSEGRVAPDGQTAWPTWAVRRKSDGAYIGRVDAEITLAMEASNVGYYFFARYWGQGYATEAVKVATQHLISCGIHRLVATVTDGNIASERVLQKTAYVFNRVLLGNDIIRGIPMDDREYVRVAP